MHEAAPHCFVFGSNSSAGHCDELPSHTSATSHVPTAARQTCVAGFSASAGHAPLVSQTSWTSHGPAASRQTVPAVHGTPASKPPSLSWMIPAPGSSCSACAQPSREHRGKTFKSNAPIDSPPAASETRTSNRSESETFVGVPSNLPSSGEMDNHRSSSEAWMDHVYGSVPSVTSSWCVYAAPTTASGS